MTLDFVIVHDYPAKYKLVRSHRLIEFTMDIAKITEYQIHETEESSLISRQLQGQPFPEGAVLYVHGNATKGYNNAGYAREFSQDRLDLRFVLQIDPVFCSQHHFRKEENHEYVKQLVSQPPHASRPVICSEDLNFFAPLEDNSYWLLTYLQELKQIRGL